MNYSSECGEKIAEKGSCCVECEKKGEHSVDVYKEKYKRLKIYSSYGMVVALSLGVFLGSRNWQFKEGNNSPTTEKNISPVAVDDSFSPDEKEGDLFTAESSRFSPAVHWEKQGELEDNQVIQDDFLLEYQGDQVILREYFGDEVHISLPEQVTVIAGEAFLKNDLMKTVTMPASLRNIEENAFAFCLSLEEINWSAGLVSLGEGSFRHCESLSVIKLPDSLEKIGANAFYGCENLQTLTMGDAVEVLEEGTFKNCWNLEDITLSQSLQKIDVAVFENCASVIEIYLPESVKKMDENLFSTCFSLKKVWVKEGSYGEDYGNKWLTDVELKLH